MNKDTKPYVKQLKFPQQYLGDRLNLSQCQHGGFFNVVAIDCQCCKDADTCQWVDNNDLFNNLEKRTLTALKSAIDEAVMLVSPTIGEHPITCSCEACEWFESTSHFLENQIRKSPVLRNVD